MICNSLSHLVQMGDALDNPIKPKTDVYMGLGAVPGPIHNPTDTDKGLDINIRITGIGRYASLSWGSCQSLSRLSSILIASQFHLYGPSDPH